MLTPHAGVTTPIPVRNTALILHGENVVWCDGSRGDIFLDLILPLAYPRCHIQCPRFLTVFLELFRYEPWPLTPHTASPAV